jgi:hypothetical protein
MPDLDTTTQMHWQTTCLCVIHYDQGSWLGLLIFYRRRHELSMGLCQEGQISAG